MPVLNYSASLPSNAYLSNNLILGANTSNTQLLNKVIANTVNTKVNIPLAARPISGLTFPRFQR